MKLAQLLLLVQLASSLGRLSGGEERKTHADGADEDARALLKEQRIIGGVYSDDGEYPYAVSLKSGNSHFCGGSLIAKDVVLSAAHCGGGSYNVVIGRHKQTSSRGETIAVREEVIHPNYRQSDTDNDFNLIFLRSPASPDAKLVRLNPTATVPTGGDSVTVLGWGDTVASESYSRLSNKLKEVELKVVSNKKCAKASGRVGFSYFTYRGQITSNMLCAQDPEEDSCQGDSGGPLVVKGRGGDQDVQIGVVSWGVGCASENFPGVYARVSSAYEWIRDEVCAKSSAPPPSFQCPPTENGQTNEAGDGGSDVNGGFAGETSGNNSDDGGGNFGSFASWACSVLSIFC